MASAELATAALNYARAGRVVFPVRGKTPLVKFAELTPETCAQRVAYWWGAWPDANIGLRTGDGHVVIDIDPRNGGEIDPRWPATRVITTPSGGVHLYYWTHEHVRNSASRVAQGVDIRGHNGFVIVPPSPGYVIKVDAPIVRLPELVDRRLAEAFYARGTHPDDWLADAFEPQDHVPKGGQHHYLMRLAGWLWHSGEIEDVDELEAVMWNEAERVLEEPPSRMDIREAQRMRARAEWIARRPQ